MDVIVFSPHQFCSEAEKILCDGENKTFLPILNLFEKYHRKMGIRWFLLVHVFHRLHKINKRITRVQHTLSISRTASPWALFLRYHYVGKLPLKCAPKILLVNFKMMSFSEKHKYLPVPVYLHIGICKLWDWVLLPNRTHFLRCFSFNDIDTWY